MARRWKCINKKNETTEFPYCAFPGNIRRLIWEMRSQREAESSYFGLEIWKRLFVFPYLTEIEYSGLTIFLIMQQFRVCSIFLFDHQKIRTSK